jgi:hypothetical protein
MISSRIANALENALLVKQRANQRIREHCVPVFINYLSRSKLLGAKWVRRRYNLSRKEFELSV